MVTLAWAGSPRHGRGDVSAFIPYSSRTYPHAMHGAYGFPAGRFPYFQEAQRSVHRDGHVEVAKVYYSVPPEYLGRRVWVRWDGRMVRIFNRRLVQIAVHAQRGPGQFSTQDQLWSPRRSRR